MKYSKWLIVGLIGFVIRIWLIQILTMDNNILQGKFNQLTDLDYKVYLDASLYESPYQRHTYRYSPLLALIMSPSYTIHQNFGKYLLAVFDLIACFFIFKIYADRQGQHNINGGVLISLLLFTNPFLIYLSIRGSCEGVTLLLGFSFLYFYFGGKAHGNMTALERRKLGIVDLQPNRLKRYVSYIIYGLWVHFRVFPIILLPMLIMYEFHSVKQNRWRHLIKYILEFGLISGGVFIGLSIYFYILYGYDFLHETYFYHLTRRDNRHSRSVFFYDLYLNYESDSYVKPIWRVLCRNLPTWFNLGFFSFYLIRKRSYFFCQGFMICYFILYNRVITDQYYTWLFSFLYLVIFENENYHNKNLLKVLWLAYRPMFICLFPVAFWAFFKYHLENATQVLNILHFWQWNLFAFVFQILIITRQLVQLTDPLKLKKAKALISGSQRVKND